MMKKKILYQNVHCVEIKTNNLKNEFFILRNKNKYGTSI